MACYMQMEHSLTAKSPQLQIVHAYQLTSDECLLPNLWMNHGKLFMVSYHLKPCTALL